MGFTPLSLDPSAQADESTVPRADFIKFIQASNNLPVEPIEDARIEIVAPVLKEGDYKWKGAYDGQAISFTMGDEVFKSSVLLGDVSFQHGSTIECVLNIHRKFDEVGEVVLLATRWQRSFPRSTEAPSSAQPIRDRFSAAPPDNQQLEQHPHIGADRADKSGRLPGLLRKPVAGPARAGHLMGSQRELRHWRTLHIC